MKSPFKVMSTAALAAAVAVPTLSVPAADAAETTSFHSVALEAEDGSVQTVPFEDYAKAKTFNTDDELGELVQSSSVVSVSVEEGKYVSLRTLALAKIETPDQDTASLLDELDNSEDNLVAEETVAEYKVFGEPDVVAVESATVVDTDKIQVNFNQAVDTEEATVELKKGAATYNTDVTFAEDGKSATIEYAIDFQSGEYDLEVSGLTEEPLVETVQVEDETATSVELKSSTLTAQNDSTVSFQVLNQYGTDMEVDGDEVVSTAYNVSKSSSVDVTGNATESLLEFGSIYTDAEDNQAEVGDEVRVTISYNGLTIQDTVEVIEVAAGSEISLADVQPLEDTARVTAGDSGLELPYTLLNQFGEEITLGSHTADGSADADSGDNQTTIDGVLFITSDASVVDPDSFAVDSDGVLTFDAGDAGTAKVTAIINSTGETATLNVDVNSNSSLENLTLSEPTKLVSAGETVELDYVAEDSYGSVLEEGNDLISVDTWESSDNSVVDASSDVYFDEDGKLQVTTSGEGDVTLTAKNANEDVLGKVSFEVQEAAEPTAITNVSDVATVLTEDAQTSISTDNVEIKDQYNRAYDLQEGESIAVYLDGDSETSVDVKQSGDVDVVGTSLTDAATVAFDDSTYAELHGTSTEGTQTAVLQLVDSEGSEVPGGSFNVDVETKALEDIASYDVKEIGSLYADGGSDFTSGYAGSIEVQAKDDKGNLVAIPQSMIKSVASSNTSVATVDKGEMAVLGQAEGEATISVIVETANGLETVKQTVEVSNESLVAQKVSSDATDNAVSVSVGDLDQDSLVAGGAEDDLTFTVTDQFGGTSLTPVDYVFSNFNDAATTGDGFTASDVSVTTGDVINVTTGTNGATTGDSFQITAVDSSGNTETVTISFD